MAVPDHRHALLRFLHPPSLDLLRAAARIQRSRRYLDTSNAAFDHMSCSLLRFLTHCCSLSQDLNQSIRRWHLHLRCFPISQFPFVRFLASFQMGLSIHPYTTNVRIWAHRCIAKFLYTIEGIIVSSSLQFWLNRCRFALHTKTRQQQVLSRQVAIFFPVSLIISDRRFRLLTTADRTLLNGLNCHVSLLVVRTFYTTKIG